MLQIYLSSQPEADLLFKRLEMTYLGNLRDWDVKQAACTNLKEHCTNYKEFNEQLRPKLSRD